MFQKREIAGVPFYAPFCTIPFVTAGFTTREGGVSEGEFASLNFRLNCQDTKENIAENVRRVCAAFHTSPEKIVTTRQEHTTRIRRVGKEDGGTGFVRPRFPEGVDGLVTNEPGLTLFTFFADCVPILLCDPTRKAVGAVHSGWRGTVGKIAAAAVEKMAAEFGSDPGDIHAAIGPHIGKCCFQVDTPVYEEFLAAFPKQGGCVFAKKDEKYYIDLSRAVEETLKEAGVGHISNMHICTACNDTEFFSHRKTGGKRGCFAALIKLREDEAGKEGAE